MPLWRQAVYLTNDDQVCDSEVMVSLEPVIISSVHWYIYISCVIL